MIFRAVVRSLQGYHGGHFSAEQHRKLREQMLALRRLVARSLWEQYQNADAQQRMFMEATAELDLPHYRSHGIRTFRQYVDFMMNSAEGNPLAYGNFHLEGLAAARALGRPIISNTLHTRRIHDIQGVQRTAVIYTTTGHFIVKNKGINHKY